MTEKLFTSISGPTLENALEQMEDCGQIELRTDIIQIPWESYQDILEKANTIILTFRPDQQLEETDFIQIRSLCQSNKVQWMDLDENLSEVQWRELSKIAEESDINLIGSFHDFNATPSFEALKEIYHQIKSKGVDYVKIATKCNNYEDSQRINQLYLELDNLIALGMGEIGVLTRFEALLAGAPFTYTAPSGGVKTAHGQVSYNKAKQIVEWLKFD